MSRSLTFRFSTGFAVALFTFPTAADVGDCMNLDAEERIADTRFKILDDSCDADGVCSYWLRIPARSEDGELTGLALVIYDTAGNDELAVELDHELLDDGDAEVIFYAHKKYSASLVVRAGFRVAGDFQCLDDIRTLPIEESHACKVREAPNVSCYFSRQGRSWPQELAGFEKMLREWGKN